MSQTLTTTGKNVRVMLKDTDLGNPAVDTPFLLHPTIIRHAQRLGEKARCSLTWVTSAFTSTAGSLSDIALSSTYKNSQMIAEVRDATYGRVLRRESLDVIDAYRTGVIPGSGARGIPFAYALWEDAGQIPTIRFNCPPSQACTYDILRRACVAELTSTSPTTADATTLDFSPPMMRAIEAAAALELAAGLAQDELNRIGLNFAAVKPEWERIRDEGVVLELQRKANLERRPFAVGAIMGI